MVESQQYSSKRTSSAMDSDRTPPSEYSQVDKKVNFRSNNKQLVACSEEFSRSLNTSSSAGGFNLASGSTGISNFSESSRQKSSSQ